MGFENYVLVFLSIDLVFAFFLLLEVSVRWLAVELLGGLCEDVVFADYFVENLKQLEHVELELRPTEDGDHLAREVSAKIAQLLTRNLEAFKHDFLVADLDLRLRVTKLDVEAASLVVPENEFRFAQDLLVVWNLALVF